MRTAPASHLRKRHARACRAVPCIGSRLREIYDLFMSRKGQIVEFSHDAQGRRLEDLRDYYGLDIRRVSRGKWVLAGEWFGRTYLDYVS